MKLDTNQASIREAIDAGLLAGAVTLIWRSGEVLQVNELGHRDVDANLPMQRDTIFRIASMTKPVTVVAAMSLLDEGKLTLAELDEEEQSLERLRRWYRTIRARDVFGAPSAAAAELRLKECAEALEAFAEQVYQARERP